MKNKTKPAEPATKPTGGDVPDGRYFQLKKISYSEAQLVEVVVKDGKLAEQEVSEDLSRIQLGKLVRRIGETFGEKA